jgi:FHA domain-containing protein
MITIRVTSHHGKSTPRGPSYDFDETGGTIGRAETNQLVLEDADRVISRVQAQVVFRGGRFALVDRGSNPVIVNGERLGKGSSIELSAGDRIEIGSYRMEVESQSITLVRGASEDDPFGLSPAMPEAKRGSNGVNAPRSEPRSGEAKSPPLPSTDPLGLFGGTGAGLASATPPSQPSSSKGLIPEDYDPFADPLAPQPHRSSPAPLLPDDVNLGRDGPLGETESLDRLFGLGQGIPSGHFADTVGVDDPFAGTSLGSDVPEAESPLDPLVALGGARRPAIPPAAVRDDLPEIRGAFIPPPVPSGGTPASNPPPSSSPAPEGAELKKAAGSVFLSWENAEDGGSVSQTMIFSPGSGPSHFTSVQAEVPEAPLPSRQPPQARASGKDAAPSAEKQASPRPAQPEAHGASSAHSATSAAPSHRQERVPPPADIEALAVALLTGLGMPDLSLSRGITPDLMERIGALLREATQGTLDLLTARAVTKREVRADVTVIAALGNNPLKFSPDVEAALAHLISPQGRGFLPPVAAMRDAYDDLRAHELGFMAGMRAALAGLLARFDPKLLEQRLVDKSVLDSLLPMNRRAKLWDLYQQLYRNIAEEAEEDFHAAFGREFLRAYEEQIARLDADKP